MGRKSKLSERQWAESNEASVRELANELLSLENNEKAVILTLKLFLMFGNLESVLKVSKIQRHRFEFAVSGGRIDLVLFHRDGGVTIVEAKAENQARFIAAGIGQLCMYASVISESLKKTEPTYINKVLVAPIKPEDSLHLMNACQMAGIRFAHLAPFDVLHGQIGKLKKFLA